MRYRTVITQLHGKTAVAQKPDLLTVARLAPFLMQPLQAIPVCESALIRDPFGKRSNP